MMKILRVAWLHSEIDLYVYLLEMKKKTFKYHLKEDNGFLWL